MLRTLSHHWRRSVTGAGLLLLAGCAGHYLVQREPWRKDAELACLQSGAVKESGTIVRIEPINGPGMCGADFPLKVAALGDQPLLGYSDIRPPGDVPGAGPQRWPVTTAPARRATPPARPVPDQAADAPDDEPRFANPARPSAVQASASDAGNRRDENAARRCRSCPKTIPAPPVIAASRVTNGLCACRIVRGRASVYDRPSESIDRR
jgi:hypothetical protein